MLDTVRADAVNSSTAPGLARLASEALDYREARSPAPLTMPAMAALMTGRYAHSVGIMGHSRRDRLMASAPTMAELAATAGYRTAAVVTNPWLALASTGFARGFDSFVSGRTLGRSHARMDATEVVALAADALAAGDGRPTFLWLHFMDAHMPYAGGDTPVLRDFAKSPSARSTIFFSAPYRTEDIAQTVAAYHDSVRAIDDALAPWLGALSDDAIVVVVADHGESLGEHDLHFAHDFTLFDELLRVPLMLRLPLDAASRRPPRGPIDAPVSLLDVLPTLCELTPLECPPGLDGRVLPGIADSSPGIGPGESRPRTLYAASAPHRARYRCPWLTMPGPEGRWTALIENHRKLIRIPIATGAEHRAFDLRIDPKETTDIFDLEVDRGGVEHLEAWSRAAAGQTRDEARALGRTTARELRALGYLD